MNRLYVLKDPLGVIHLVEERWAHPDWEFLGVLKTEFETELDKWGYRE